MYWTLGLCVKSISSLEHKVGGAPGGRDELKKISDSLSVQLRKVVP